MTTMMQGRYKSLRDDPMVRHVVAYTPTKDDWEICPPNPMQPWTLDGTCKRLKSTRNGHPINWSAPRGMEYDTRHFAAHELDELGDYIGDDDTSTISVNSGATASTWDVTETDAPRSAEYRRACDQRRQVHNQMDRQLMDADWAMIQLDAEREKRERHERDRADVRRALAGVGDPQGGRG